MRWLCIGTEVKVWALWIESKGAGWREKREPGMADKRVALLSWEMAGFGFGFGGGVELPSVSVSVGGDGRGVDIRNCNLI
jgi:hypothetical protein